MSYTPRVRSSAQLLADINSLIVTNNRGNITGEVLNNLLQDLTVSLSQTVYAENFIQNCEDGLNLSGQGISQVLSTLGYTDQTAAEQFPKTALLWGSIDSSNITYDSCVLQESFAKLGYSFETYLTSLTDRVFIVNHQIIIPSVKLDVDVTSRLCSQQYVIDLKGVRINDIRTDANLLNPLFISVPTDEARAANHDLEFSFSFLNFEVYGAVNSGVPYSNSSCFELKAKKRLFFKNVCLSNYDNAFVGSLLMNSVIDQCEFRNCISSGLKTVRSDWTNATVNSSPSQLTVFRSRFKDAGLKYLDLSNADTTSVVDCQLEGNGGDYGVFTENNYDAGSGNGTVLKNFRIENLRVEQESRFARAISGFKLGDGFAFTLDTCYQQAVEAGTVLVEGESTGGYNRVKILNSYNSGGAAAWAVRNIENGGQNCWNFEDVSLVGEPKTTDDLIHSSEIFDTNYGGSIPSQNMLKISPRLPI